MTDISGIGKPQKIAAPETQNPVAKPASWGKYSVVPSNAKNRLPPPPPGGIPARTQGYRSISDYKVGQHNSRLTQGKGAPISIKKQLKQAIRQIQNKGLSRSKAKKQTQALVKNAKALVKKAQDNQQAPNDTKLQARPLSRPAASISARKRNITNNATAPLATPAKKRRAPAPPSSANTIAARAPLKPVRPAPPPPGKINNEPGNTPTRQKPSPPPPIINKQDGNSRKTQSLPKKRKAPPPPPPAPPPPPLGGKSVHTKQVGSPSIAGDTARDILGASSPETVRANSGKRKLLLNEIEKGVQLKPVSARKNNTGTNKATGPSDLKSALIEEIKKGGNKLTKVEPGKRPSPEMDSLQREILEAMEKRRNAIADKEEEWSKNDENESGDQTWNK